MTTPATCRVCGRQVFRNTRGETLMHTRFVGVTYDRAGGPLIQHEVCEGSTRGARP